MARGWESKSVEDQIATAQERRAVAASSSGAAARLALTSREREILMLDRKRVERDLQATTNPRYKQILERALAYLDHKLAALETVSKGKH